MDIQTRIGTNNRMADKHIARQANKQKYYQRNKNGERQTKKANINMESRQTKIWTDGHTNRQTKIWTERHRQTCRPKYGETCKQTIKETKKDKNMDKQKTRQIKIQGKI